MTAHSFQTSSHSGLLVQEPPKQKKQNKNLQFKVTLYFSNSAPEASKTVLLSAVQQCRGEREKVECGSCRAAGYLKKKKKKKKKLKKRKKRNEYEEGEEEEE